MRSEVPRCGRKRMNDEAVDTARWSGRHRCERTQLDDEVRLCEVCQCLPMGDQGYVEASPQATNWYHGTFRLAPAMAEPWMGIANQDL